MVVSLKPALAGYARSFVACAGVALVVLASLPLPSPVSAQVQRTFVNLGFEQPSAGSASCYFQVSESIVPSWTTNHPTQNGVGCAPNVAQTPGPLIEVWANGSQNPPLPTTRTNVPPRLPSQ